MTAHRTRVAKSLVWTSLESFGVSGISLISIVVYARFLTPTELGVSAMALGVVQLLNIPVEVLFHDALVQRKEATQRHFDTAYAISVLLGILLLAVCWLGADWFSMRIGTPAIAPVLQWMSLSLPFMGFATAVTAQQRRAMEFRPLAIRSVVGRTLGGITGIVMAIAGAGVWSLVAQQVLTVAFSTIILWLLATTRPSWRISVPESRELLSFGFFSTTVTFLAVSIQRIFTLMVGALLGTHVAGYFDLAFRVVHTTRDLFFGAVSQLSLPLFSRLQENRQTLAAAYSSAMQFTCIFMFPLFIGLAVCSSEIVILFFGERWQAAIPILATVAVLTVVFFARAYSASMMSAAGRPSFPISFLAVEVAFIVAGMWLIGRESYIWACVIWASRILLSTPVDMLMLKRATGLSMHDQIRGLPMLLLCAIGMALAVLAVKYGLVPGWPLAAKLSLMVVVGALVYPALLWIADRGLVRRIVAFTGEVRRKRVAA